MYELNRARLIGAGPRAARYSDVTLDLSGVGAPVTTGSLYDQIRRPSPFSLLYLENGGGKTVLLKLLFSVLLPGKRNVVGGKGASLDRFVLENDTGHVLLEWMHVDTGALLVTGKTFQQRNRTTGNTNPLDEAWYTFRPGDPLTLDTVPVAVDSRRRKLENYRQQLLELFKNDAGLDLAWITEHGVWRTHLANQGLDPDLYQLQRSMNADEGDAANEFSFTSSRAFVQWLLKMVTSPDDAAAVAARFEELAVKVAERSEMIAERDFLEAAAAGLAPIADAHAGEQAAIAGAEQARHRAGTLHAALTARAANDEQVHEQLRAQLSDADADQLARETHRDNARSLENEVELQTFVLAHRDADAAVSTAKEAVRRRSTTADAWEAVPLIAADRRARARMTAAARVLSAAHEQAQPLLEARDRAASALSVHLAAEAIRRDDAAREHAAAIGDHEASLVEIASHAEAATRASAAAATRRKGAEAVQREAADALNAAIDSGLVPAGTSATAVAGLAAAADTAVETTGAAVDAARETKTKLQADSKAQDAAARVARTTANSRHAEATAAANHERALRDVAAELAALPTVADVAGLDDGEQLTAGQFDRDADTITAALAETEKALTAELSDLGIDQLRDQRILDALGSGGLLPPRAEVTDVIAELATVNITAYSGWKYLSTAVDPSEHQRLIDTFPQLVDGVVLAIDTDQQRAAEHLAGVELLPPAAIAVGTTALLDGDPARLSEPGAIVVVDPSPAMYNADAAARRRDDVQAAQDERATAITERTITVNTTRAVISRLQTWRERNPLGHLQAAADDTQSKQEQAAAAFEVADQADAAAAALVEQVRIADARAEDLTDELLRVSGRRDQLHTLARSQWHADEARRTIEEADEDFTTAEADLGRAVADRTATQSLLDDSRAAKTSAEQDAARCRSRMNELVNTGTATDDAMTADTAIADTDLTTLEAAYTTTHANYVARAPNDELQRQLDQAREAVKQTEQQIGMLDSAIAGTARSLLDSPDGGDPAVWTERASTARAARAAAEDALQTALGILGNAEAQVANSRPREVGRSSWTTLPPEWTPRDVEHGRNLKASAHQRWVVAQREHQEAIALADSLRERHRAAVQAATEFAQHARILEVALDRLDHTGTRPADIGVVLAYADTAAAAEADVTAAREQLNTTGAALAGAAAALRDALRDLEHFIKQPEYDALPSQLRQTLLSLPSDKLAARAREWALDAQNRYTSLVTDIEAADRHRSGLVDQLANLAQRALKTLDNAQRLSALPAALGSWGGKEFIKIRFTRPDLPTVTARVGDLIDRRAVEHVAGRKTGRVVPGLNLLLDAVDAAVPNGFQVTILKPDAVLRDERVPVEQMGTIFSGGQELTAAIVLYCTLAALQANERGQERARHAGVLFLDNPIGKASASYLLDIQQGVATSLGVQLVYTTGLSDDRALAAFPLWVRLRNDADLRHGLKHISIADEVRRALPPHDNDADGQMSATRIYVRPDTHRDDDGPPPAAAAS